MGKVYTHEEKGLFGHKRKKQYWTTLEIDDGVVTSITILWGIYEPPISKGEKGVVVDIGFEEPWHRFLGCLIDFNTYRDKHSNSQVWVPESALRKIS